MTVNTNRGTAYILFAHEPDAEAAIAHMHESQVDGATINVSIVLARRKMSPAPPLARRGANINPLNPLPGRRGVNGPGPKGRGGRFGPRSDTWRPRSLSRSASRSASPPRGRRGRSPSYERGSRSRSPRRRRTPSRDSYGSFRERSLSRGVSPPRGHGRRGYR